MESGRPQPTVVPAATDDSALSGGDWLYRWLRQYVRRDRAVNTQERYTSIVDRYLVPEIGAIPLARLTPSHIDDLEMRLVGEGLTPKTVNLIHTVLSGALRHAVRLELIQRNPALEVIPPAFTRREIMPPEIQGVRRRLSVARSGGHPLYPLLHLITYTGLLRGEALALRWDNVALEGRYIHIVESAVKTHREGVVVGRTKTGKSVRTVDLDPIAVDV